MENKYGKTKTNKKESNHVKSNNTAIKVKFFTSPFQFASEKWSATIFVCSITKIRIKPTLVNFHFNTFADRPIFSGLGSLRLPDRILSSSEVFHHECLLVSDKQTKKSNLKANWARELEHCYMTDRMDNWTRDSTLR